MQLSFKEWLITEASRWKQSSWQKPQADAFKRLKKYNKAGYYCSFTFMPNKLGVNPMASFSGGDSGTNITPYGIYAYTVPYIIQTARKTGFHDIPYAADRPYIWVFVARNPRKIKKIRNPYDANAQLWEKAKRQSDPLGMFHSYFLKRGIEGFVDDGTGTIHSHEPYQAVFFGSQTITPVDVFTNSEITKVIGIPDDFGQVDYYPDYIPLISKPQSKIDPIQAQREARKKAINDELGSIKFHLGRWDISNNKKNELMYRKNSLEQELSKIA